MEKLLRTTLPGGRFANVSKARSQAMAAVKGKHNRTTEIQFRMALVRDGVTGWITHSKLPGKPDVYFPNARIAIFLDGCFWHGCGRCGHVPKTNSLFWSTKIGRNQERDRRNSRLLRKEGILVIRAWEHSLNDANQLQRILQRIQVILREAKKH
jgi:DNA mismatch endonuclease (patch repair protein)